MVFVCIQVQYKLQYYCSNASISSADFSAEPYKVSLQARSTTPVPVSRVHTTTGAPEPMVPTGSHQSHSHDMDQATEKPTQPSPEMFTPGYQAVGSSPSIKSGDEIKTDFGSYEDPYPALSRGKFRLFICPCLL